MVTVRYLKKKKVLLEDNQHCSPPFKKVLRVIPEIINLGGTSVQRNMVERMIKDQVIKDLDEDNMMGTNQHDFYSLSDFFEIVNK